MKKAIAIILALMILFSIAALAACNGDNADGNAQTETDSTANNNTTPDTSTNIDTTPSVPENTDVEPVSDRRVDDFSDGRIQRMLDNGERFWSAWSRICSPNSSWPSQMA